jgi:phosphatidylserine/phosphatidylglycerophosphate/cardiolipin synthase-like enzyme
MKQLFLGTALALMSTAHAAKMSDFSPYNFEVLFTNPVCAEYRYDRPVLAEDGTTLTAKPKDVYCKSSDLAASAERSISPQYRLIEWTNDAKTKELFLAYLSFSNKPVADALCAAVKRGVKLTMVLDSAPEEDATGNALAEGLKKCGTNVTIHYRGQRNGLGYAHNKIFMVNPEDKKEVRVVFSSGNMSTGTVIHHENWNFVTASPKTHFIQAHLCVREGMINHGDSKKQFSDFIATCRKAIPNAEETDLKTFFVPGEGKQAFAALRDLALKSTRVEATAHRFSGNFIRLFTELLTNKQDVRLITDDDMYWSWKLREDTGRNTRIEAFKVLPLRDAGLKMKFMETNHPQVMLQHNKFMVFELGAEDAVFTGAGNFTSAAFDQNFENFYIIRDQAVVKAFQAQYDRMWNKLATPAEKMPRQNILP